MAHVSKAAQPFPRRVFQKAAELAFLCAVLGVPMVLSLQTNDQFELPKLTFLVVLGSFFLLCSAWGGFSAPKTSGCLPLAVGLLGGAFLTACLPGISFSPLTSLVGEYENFAGFWTWGLFFLWFFALSGGAPVRFWRKGVAVGVCAGVWMCFYAFAQRTGLDPIRWDAGTYVSGRFFATLGNPNFLAAWLAQWLPFLFWLHFEAKHLPIFPRRIRTAAALGLAGGGVLLFFATPAGRALLELPPTVVTPSFTWIGAALSLAGLFPLCLPATPLRLVFGAALFCSALLFTGSRGGLLAAAGGGAVLFFTLPGALFKEKVKPLLSSRLVLSLGGILFAAGVFFGSNHISRFFHSLRHPWEAFQESRLHIWTAAWRMIQDRFPIGVGLDTFKIAFPIYAPEKANALDGVFVSSRTAHNEMLQIAATTGLAGFTAYLFLLWAACNAFSQFLRRQPPHCPCFAVSAGIASFAAYLIQNFFSFSTAALNFTWFALLAAFHGATSPFRPANRFSRFLLFFLFSASFFSAVIGLRRFAGDVAFLRSEVYRHFSKAALSKTPEKASDLCDQAIFFSKRALENFPWDVKYVLYHALSYENAGLSSKDTESFIRNLLTAREYYGKTIYLSPWNAYYHHNLGRIDEMLAGRVQENSRAFFEAAAESYRKAAELAPVHPLFHAAYGISAFRIGNSGEAELALRRALKLDPRLAAERIAQAVFQMHRQASKEKAEKLARLAETCAEDKASLFSALGLAAQASGDWKKVEDYFQKALAQNPNQPEIRKYLERLREAPSTKGRDFP